MAQYELMHGQCVLVGHVFDVKDLEAGTLWIPADGAVRRIRLESANVLTSEVTYRDIMLNKRFVRDAFEFQTRYHLVIDHTAKFAHLVQETQPAALAA